jgi:hypothetical protein
MYNVAKRRNLQLINNQQYTNKIKCMMLPKEEACVSADNQQYTIDCTFFNVQLKITPNPTDF